MPTDTPTTAPPPPLYASLRQISLNTVRRSISKACYQRSALRTLGWFAFDLALYLGAPCGRCSRATVPGPSSPSALAAGCAVAFMFVWAHDAAHGALFRRDWTAEILGTIVMLPSLNMYRLWSHGHNRVHHGFTSYTPIDWIWRPLTPSRLRRPGPLGPAAVSARAHARITCALHYLVQVWWPGMVMFRPERRSRERLGFAVNKLVTVGFVVALSAVAYRFGGGVMGVVAAVVVLPFIVFNYFIALFVFLHHTHPDVPFFDQRPEWSNSIGQVYCSIVVRCSPLSELLIHNIMIHTPHHVDPTIPFYRLKRAYGDLQREYRAYIHEYRFRWSTVRMIFRRCKLYDYERQAWYGYREAPRVSA